MTKLMLMKKIKYSTQVPTDYTGPVAIVTKRTLPMATSLPLEQAIDEVTRLYVRNPQGEFYIIPAVA